MNWTKTLLYFNKMELHHIFIHEFGLIWNGFSQDDGSVDIHGRLGLPIGLSLISSIADILNQMSMQMNILEDIRQRISQKYRNLILDIFAILRGTFVDRVHNFKEQLVAH